MLTLRESLLVRVLLYDAIKILESVEDMDANTAVESRCFQDPHILAFVVGFWDIEFRTLKASLP